MTIFLDHVTVGARTLEEGVAYLREQLGIEMPAGGKHPDMGTHNCVARVGDGVFLELIAIDPEAPRPARPRWFGLDDPGLAARLAVRPRPVGWVLRTDNLARVTDASQVDLGAPLAMSRGTRSWRITVPATGCTAFDGLTPAVIEWSEGPHPSSGMSFLGPRLTGIELRHRDAIQLSAALEAIGAGSLASVVEDAVRPAMIFTFMLPDGSMRTLA